MDLRPFMERWHMLPPSGGVMLVAVSGGRDSVCLLHYLAAMPRDFTVAAAHLNHGQRPTAGRGPPPAAGSYTPLPAPRTPEHLAWRFLLHKKNKTYLPRIQRPK